jgi:hypothetical protein
MNVLEVMKEVGRRWKSITPEFKAVFEAQAKEDKKRFDKEITEFNKEINKVSITPCDGKKRSKTQRKGSKSRKVSKSSKKGKRKTRRTSENYADYYYPTRVQEVSEGTHHKNKCDYSLRRRNRQIANHYYSSESEESEESESDKISYKRSVNADNQDNKLKTSIPIMPKKPLSAYIYFSQKIRDKIRQELPNLTASDLLKEISNRWSSMSVKEKKPYEQMAKEDKQRYEDEYEQYKTQSKDLKEEALNDIEIFGTTRQSNQVNQRTFPNQPDYEFFHNRDPRPTHQINPPPMSRNNITISVNVDRKGQNEENKHKRERRTKKNFDSSIKKSEFDDPTPNLIPSNSDILLEPRMSAYSTNRYLINEGPERYKPDSFYFNFNEEEGNNVFLNKEIPPENEFISPFNVIKPEQDPIVQEDPRMSGKDFVVRQDSNKYSAIGEIPTF